MCCLENNARGNCILLVFVLNMVLPERRGPCELFVVEHGVIINMHII